MNKTINKKNKFKKSIIFVVWLFPKISETFVLNQIIHLKKKGYKISIFAIKNPSRKLTKEDIECEKLVHEDVKKYNLLNITTYGTPAKINSLIREKIAEKKVDIIYFQFPDLGAEVLKYKKIKCPILVVFHDMPKIKSKEKILKLKKKYKLVFKYSTFILPISELSKKMLIKLGCDKNKIIIHHMGVDTTIFKSVNEKYSNLNPFIFLMIGRFVEKKGFIYGIKAFKKVSNKYKKSKLVIIGDGILREKLQKKVEELNLQKRVDFLGKLSQKKVVENLNQAHCFLCPSITTKEGKREGIPTTIMEAAACGLVIIATRHAGILEILANNQGVLVKEKSVKELSKAMIRILTNYKKNKNYFSKRAEKFIKKEFNVKKQVEKLLKIFNLAFSLKKEIKH